MQFLKFADSVRYKTLDSDGLRECFLVDSLFQPGQVDLCYTESDRCIAGSVVPLTDGLTLPVHKEMASTYFCERRELGVINVGGRGKVTVDSQEFELGDRDSLYVGRGSRDVVFTSLDPQTPARFYFTSYPAHREYPTKLVKRLDARRIEAGTEETCNKRVISQSIRPGIVESCQLVMGFTELAPGSVWNTMPSHTHKRRTEVYAYFGLGEDERVFHFMGEPGNIRPIVVGNGNVVASPSWSIHSGVGTRNYFFIWSMGGENQEFDDMDGLTIADIR